MRRSERLQASAPLVPPLVMALLLALAACGPASGASTTPVASTPTATPRPCSTWATVASGGPAPYAQSRLLAVAALSPSQAWAVGETFTNDTPVAVATLTERWDGSAWRMVPSAGGAALNGVAAVAANDVWAVGAWPGPAESTPASERHATILRWDGTRWTSVAAADTGASIATLQAVTAVSAHEVWAAGYLTTESGEELPLVERWDGSTWRTVAIPNPPGGSGTHLLAITRIPGTDQLWASGLSLVQEPTVDYALPLLERWDGSAWSVVPGPSLPAGSYGAVLNGVVALSATDAWAVGSYTASDRSIRALAAHWDGSTWKLASGPDVLGHLSAVAAASAHDVRATGYQFTGAGGTVQSALIEEWDGQAWRMAQNDPAPPRSAVSGVAPDLAGGYWAAGDAFSSASVYQALIMRCG